MLIERDRIAILTLASRVPTQFNAHLCIFFFFLFLNLYAFWTWQKIPLTTTEITPDQTGLRVSESRHEHARRRKSL